MKQLSLRRRAGRLDGFTLVELLVVIAIIGVLVSLLLPAIQASREAARRASCVNNLRQVAVALHEYEFAHERFPIGVRNDSGPIRNLPEADHLSWIVQILPQLGEPSRFRATDYSVGAYHKRNDPVRQTKIDTLICPSYPGVYAPVSCYAGVHHHRESPIDADNHGVLFLNSRIRIGDLVDGPAYTLMVGEKTPRGLQELGWMSGTPATLRNTGWPINAERTLNNGWQRSAGPPPWYGGDADPFGEYGGDFGGFSEDEQWTAEESTPPDDLYYDGVADNGAFEKREGGEASTAPESVPSREESQENAANRPAGEDDRLADSATDDAEVGPAGDDQPVGDAAASSPVNREADDRDAAEKVDPTTNEERLGSGKQLNPYIPRGGNPQAPLKVGGFGSAHPGLANFIFADGSVRMLSEDTSKRVLQRLADRRDGEIVESDY